MWKLQEKKFHGNPFCRPVPGQFRFWGQQSPHPDTQHARPMKEQESPHLPRSYILLVTFQRDRLGSQWGRRGTSPSWHRDSEESWNQRLHLSGLRELLPKDHLPLHSPPRHPMTLGEGQTTGCQPLECLLSPEHRPVLLECSQPFNEMFVGE